MDGSGGLFSGLWWVARGKLPMEDLNENKGGDDAYRREWEARDAELQANGFGPSKLGPGVPAVTYTSHFGGGRTWDDSGIEIPYSPEGQDEPEPQNSWYGRAAKGGGLSSWGR